MLRAEHREREDQSSTDRWDELALDEWTMRPVKKPGIALLCAVVVMTAIGVATLVQNPAVRMPGSTAGRDVETSGASGSSKGQAATIERVVDGDTVVVQLDGASERVRMLNIDTPESVKPNADVECLGPEASIFLTDILPAGTPITLQYDVERRDRYDRLLAAIFTSDGVFVNAQVAAAGYADVVVFGANDRFEPDIREAVEAARASGLGLWAVPLRC